MSTKVKAPLRKQHSPEFLEMGALIKTLSRGKLEDLCHFLIGAAQGDMSEAQMLAIVKQAVTSNSRPAAVPLPDVRSEYGAILEAAAHMYALYGGRAPTPQELTEAAVEGFAYKALFDHSEGGARRLQRSKGWSDEQVEAIEAARADLVAKVQALGNLAHGPIRFA